MSQVVVIDLKEDGTGDEVRCDKCHSPYAIDPAKRKNTLGDNSPKPRFRKRLDVTTNKILTLCNKCGLKMSREQKRPPKKPLPTDKEKRCYLEEAKMFAASLAERLQDPDAKSLYCPNVKTNPCGCLQRYIEGGEEDSSKSYERAFYLTSLLKNAKDLSTEKMHTANSSEVSTLEKNDTVLCRGIGNRHSKMFEEFVLSNRKHLREQLKFCERASQKVLMYSNNFLHKELKSMKNQRVERKVSKYAKMKPMAELASINCCKDHCGQQAITQPEMLESWRLSAQGGQREARRVIAEMLTPSLGSKSNCCRFISFVTGCSFTTICSVNNHLRKTSGSMDPPEHGLKKWWRENPKKGRRKEGPTTKKSMKTEEKYFNEDALELEAAAVDSDLITPRSSLPPPSYETVLCSKESILQIESPKLPLFELPDKVDVQELQVQQNQEIVESNAQLNSQNPLAASNSSLLQSTVQQLLLAPDIVSVTVLAAPKFSSRHVQIMTMDNAAKEGVMLTQTVGSGQGINSAIKQNLSKDKLASDFGGNYSMQPPVGERFADFNTSSDKHAPESIQRRQLLHVFEIPHRESPSQTSALSYFAEKAQSQMLSIISPSDLESVTGAAMSEQGGGSCMRSLIILPETIVLDPTSPGYKNTISPDGAVCDSRAIFTHCLVGYAGSVHDARVLKNSRIAHYLSENYFPNDTQIIGDAAYGIHRNLLVPFRDSGHFSMRQKEYNKRLSAARQTIERAFGLLKGRFRSLRDKLALVDMTKIPEFILACCVLHNICTERRDEVPEEDVAAPEFERLPIEVDDGRMRVPGRANRELLTNCCNETFIFSLNK